MLYKLIHRPIAVTSILLVTIVLGIVSIKRLPVSLIPDIDIPYITIQFNSAGLSARELSSNVIQIVNEQLMQTEGLENIEAQSNDGVATIKLTFSHKTNMDYALIEVNERIDRCMTRLGQTSRPIVRKSNASDIPAFYLNLTLTPNSQIEFSQLSDYAQSVISKRLEQLNEVSMVDVSGYDTRQIQIIPDASKLKALEIDQAAFNKAILQSNIELNSLSIKDGYYRYNVKFASKISNIQDIKNIRLKVNNSIYKVEDLAQVEMMSQRRLGITECNGKRSITMAVIKQSDSKMSSLKVSVKKLIVELESAYPGIEFTTTQDQTQLLEYSIDNLIKNIIAGIIIASLIIFLFIKDIRSSALVCLTMPLSLIFSMGVFYLVGLSLNIVSLSGLLLGIGMMADNTIILIDNITSKVSQGAKLKQAVLDGTKDVIGPMLSSVLTTCAVFIPLIFLSGIAGKLFYDQAMAITIVLLTSYIITITIIPVYYYWWFKRKPVIARKESNRDEKLTLWFMNHSHFAWSIITLSILGIFICFNNMEKEKLPALTNTSTLLYINWNEQIGLKENMERVKMLEEYIKPQASKFTSSIGTQDFILKHAHRLSPNECELYIECRSSKELAKIQKHISDYLLGLFPLCVKEFRPANNILEATLSNDQAKLVAKVSIYDNNKIDNIRDNIDTIKTALPFAEISEIPSKQDMLLTAKADLLALFGISYAELASCLKNAFGENVLFSFTQADQTIPIVIGSNACSFDEILNNTIIHKGGIDIPISYLLDISGREDFKTIYSDASREYYPINLDIPSKLVPQAIKTIDKAVGPSNVRYSGSFFTDSKMVKDLILILIVAIILLYLILACQFESFLQPLLILCEVGVDILFSLIVLWISGISINLMSMIGLVVVCGIVINDSILKVDSINKLRRNGFTTKDAVLLASKKRKKAIIMTSLTTIFAILPFMERGNMGADLQYPLMLVIVAGLTVGTFVSLYILPALYYSIYGKNKRQ